MALTKGTNSYVTVDEADNYFEDRIEASAWNDASDAVSEQALVTATLLLDALTWEGESATATSTLAWPRSGSFTGKSRNRVFSFSSSYTFPGSNEIESDLNLDIQLLRRATYELALHFLDNSGVLNDAVEGRDISVGSVSLRTVKSASRIPRRIRNIIADMLNDSGTRSWDGV